MAKIFRKRRTRAHVIADLSVNHVEKCVLQCGWTVQRVSADYGIDLLVTTFNREGEIESGEVRVQVKATDSIKIRPGQDAIPIRLQWRDAVYWLNDPLPVVLVVFDAKADRAWLLTLQEALREEARRHTRTAAATLTLYAPLTNVLDAGAVRGFRRLRDALLARNRGQRYEN